MNDLGSLYTRIEADTTGLKKAETDISSFAKRAAGYFAGMLSVATVANAIKTVTMATARYDTLGVVMNNVGKNAGYSAREMATYEKQVQKTGISMTSTRQTLVKLAQAQIDLSKATDLARIAQDAAVIGNIDSSEAFERMIHGLQAGEVEILRNIGLQVNFEKAYEEAAATLGKTSKELTTYEKTQARVSAVVKEGAKIQGTYAASMEMAGKKWTSLNRHVSNAQVLMGRLFQPAFGTLVDRITKSIKDFNDSLDEKTIREWGSSLDVALKNTLSFAEGVQKLSDAFNTPGIFQIAIVGGILAKFGPQAATAAAGVLTLNNALDDLKLGSIQQGVSAYQGFAESIGNIWDVVIGKRDFNTGELLLVDDRVGASIKENFGDPWRDAEREAMRFDGSFAKLRENLKNDDAGLVDTKELLAAEKERLAIIQRMSQLKIDFMPDGLDKELAQFNLDYSADIKDIAESQGLGQAAAEKYYESLGGSKTEAAAKITSQWMSQYKDSVKELSASFDALDDTSLSEVQKGIKDIESGFDEWRDSAAEVSKELSGSTKPEVVNLAKGVQVLINKSKELEPELKKAFETKVLTDFEKELKELNESFSDAKLSEYEQELKSVNKAYDSQIEKAKELWGQSKQYYVELKKIEAARQQAIRDDETLARTGTNMWNGFVQGVRDAEKELKSLGQLGHEVARDLHYALSGTLVNVMKGQFDEIGNNWKDLLSRMKDNLLTFLADKASSKILSSLFDGSSSLFGGVFGDLFAGIGGATYTSGAMNVYVTNNGGLGSGGGIISGLGGTAAKSWVSEVFGEAVAGYFSKAMGAVAVGAGAYGMYSGYKNMKKGNTGAGAVQMGLGAASTYQGAVTLGLIEKGAATEAAKWAAAKMGYTAAGKAAAGYATSSYTAGSGATSYSTFQAASTASQAGSTAGASAGSYGASAAGAAAYAVPIAAAVLVAMGAYNKSQRPQAENEIDKMGITPGDLGQFYEGWRSIKDTIVETIPGISQYEQALYDANSGLLVATSATSTLALQYDAAAEAGHQWEMVMHVGGEAAREAIIAADEFTNSLGQSAEGMGKAAEIAYVERDAMNWLSDTLNGTADAAGNLSVEGEGLSAAALNAANSTSIMASTIGHGVNLSTGSESDFRSMGINWRYFCRCKIIRRRVCRWP